MTFAIGVAIGAGLLSLPLVAFADPVTRQSGFALMELTVAAIAGGGAMGEPDAYNFARLTSFMWTAIMAICVAPLVAVALIGELAKVRAFLWYSGATGAAAASAPWLIRAALRLPRAADYSSAELRFALIFFISGLISGAVYWFLAGRSANGRKAS